VGAVVLDHPYPEGTRVRHAGDDSVGALATGTARVLKTAPDPGGELTYQVRTDDGAEAAWPSYFTIPVSNTASGRHSARQAPQPAAGAAAPAPASA
jgi:hypothetical protein